MMRSKQEIYDDVRKIMVIERDFFPSAGRAYVKTLSQDDRPQALEAFFELFESFPDFDFGAPGPLVHYIEKESDYAHLLAASLRRCSTHYTLLMAQRVLNQPRGGPAESTLMELIMYHASAGVEQALEILDGLKKR